MALRRKVHDNDMAILAVAAPERLRQQGAAGLQDQFVRHCTHGLSRRALA
jgi:hypothetical protein